MQTTKPQISLRIRAVWSAPLLFAAWIVYTSTCYSWNFKTPGVTLGGDLGVIVALGDEISP